MNTPPTTSKYDDLAVRNAKLVSLLGASRTKLRKLSAEIDALSEPASSYGVFLGFSGTSSDGVRDAEVFAANRRMRVKVSPDLRRGDLAVGELVRLGEGHVVVEACGYNPAGQLVTVLERVDNSRALITTPSGEEHVVLLAGQLLGSVRAGDTVIADLRSGVATEIVEKTDLTQLTLEEVPDVTFADIGGLKEQISTIRDSVELPFRHPELYERYDLHPPKGVLLYGPPGCGKTLIAKAVANSLAGQHDDAPQSYFLNVKGPELLNKFVGETERRIRLIFERARELALKSARSPVVIFFDEMESIFRTRGSGVSSDMETTVVPQLLTELDGVEDLRNVIVIGATNREELIDPAIMRPGRLDIKIRVSRPDRAEAKDIFSRFLAPGIPQAAPTDELIDAAVEELFQPRPYVRLELADGSRETLTFADFVSGAMIGNIVSRAKKLAIKDDLSGRSTEGIATRHLVQGIRDEQLESEDLPNTASPDEWARISGRSGARVVSAEVVIDTSGAEIAVDDDEQR